MKRPRLRPQDLWVTAIAFVLGSYVFLSVNRSLAEVPPDSQPAPTDDPRLGVYPDDIAPDFALPGLDLQEHRLSDYRGQKVLLNFFSTWCEPCRLEMPGVQAQYEKHREHGWVVIGIDIMEPAGDVLAFREEFDLTFPIMLDGAGRVSQLYEIRGTPTNITLDQDGRIVDRQLGYMNEEAVEALLMAVK